MSLYVKFKSTFGSERFFRIRSPYSSIGETTRGILSDRSHQNTLISIVRKSDGYSIYSHQTGETFHLSFGDRLKTALDNYDILLIATHQTSEFLTLENLISEPSPSPIAWAEALLLNAHIKAPIHHGVTFTIGSDEADSLYIPLEGIKKSHAQLFLKNETLYIEGEALDISIEGSALIIHPLALPIHISGARLISMGHEPKNTSV